MTCAILMFDYSGLVVEDTSGNLEGKQLDLPPETVSGVGVISRAGPNQTWHDVDVGGGNLTVVAAFPHADCRRTAYFDLARRPASSELRRYHVEVTFVPAYRIAMAVSESTVARAWLDLLPWLALAAVIALPFAVGSAIVIARNITRPLSKLTVAADRMAQGAFDIDVPTDRRDEVGQLSRAFSAMATNVGETHMQMRALVANVSHDMRTPLTSILGFAQALRGGVIAGEEESKHAGEVIYSEVAKLSERLNDLLFLSEIEAGQALLQREDVDLTEMVASAIERIGGVEERGITLSRDLTPGVLALADRAKLERAVENLLDNARKFTPSGGDILVRTCEDGPGDSLPGGHEHRYGHRGRRDTEALRALLPARRRSDRQIGGQRPRPADRARPRGAARRHASRPTFRMA